MIFLTLFTVAVLIVVAVYYHSRLSTYVGLMEHNLYDFMYNLQTDAEALKARVDGILETPSEPNVQETVTINAGDTIVGNVRFPPAMNADGSIPRPAMTPERAAEYERFFKGLKGGKE